MVIEEQRKRYIILQPVSAGRRCFLHAVEEGISFAGASRILIGTHERERECVCMTLAGVHVHVSRSSGTDVAALPRAQGKKHLF